MELNCLISSRGIERTISDLNDKLQLHLSETASVIISPISDMQSQILDAWKREYWETRRLAQYQYNCNPLLSVSYFHLVFCAGFDIESENNC